MLALTTAQAATSVYHFTHLDNLSSVVVHGLLSDLEVGRCLANEAGEPRIKDRRRTRTVPVNPGGVVADYVPFYFAPRSPMMYSISRGNVPTFSGDHHDLIYLCSTLGSLSEAGCQLVLSDRNAVLDYTRFESEPSEWFSPDFIDWTLMKEQWWNNTIDHPQRKERRMAECLSYNQVPWASILAIGVNDLQRQQMVATLVKCSSEVPKIFVRPEWYF